MNKPLIRATGDFFSRFFLQKQRRHQILSRSSSSTILNSTIYSNSIAMDDRQIPSQIPKRQVVRNFPFFMFNSLSSDFKFIKWQAMLKEKEENQIFSIQYQANDGIEDRIVADKLKSIPAEIINVFDGHGGDRLSQYCALHIVDLVDTYLSENTCLGKNQEEQDQHITLALKYAYEQLQKGFYRDVFEPLLALNNRKIRNMGTCALTIIVYNKKIYVSNCGDSEAILVSKNEQNSVVFTELNQRFSVNNQQERELLTKKFPNDNDIIVEDSSGSFYVKGRLQPTRSIGDYYLKHSHLFKGKGDFNGPYITSQPEIKIFNISQKDQTIILASDGVWDFLNKRQVAEASLQQSPHQQILQKTLQKIAGLHKVSIDEIKSIEKGEKRSFHDDISIIVLKLGSQIKKPLFNKLKQFQ